MVLITPENNEKYKELRRNEETKVGELRILIDKMGLTGTVKKNVGGASNRTKLDIRAEILKAYPDPDRPPLGEVSANPRAPPPPPPEYASPVATRRAAVPLRTPQQKLDDALETRDKAAAVASLKVLSPSGFKGMKNKLNEVKKRFPEEAEGVKGLGAKGYTLADFGESLIKALEKAMGPSAPPGAEATLPRVVEAPAPGAPRAAATPDDAVLAEEVAADERRGGARHRVEADGALLGLLLRLGLGLLGRLGLLDARALLGSRRGERVDVSGGVGLDVAGALVPELRPPCDLEGEVCQIERV